MLPYGTGASLDEQPATVVRVVCGAIDCGAELEACFAPLCRINRCRACMTRTANAPMPWSRRFHRCFESCSVSSTVRS